MRSTLVQLSLYPVRLRRRASAGSSQFGPPSAEHRGYGSVSRFESSPPAQESYVLIIKKKKLTQRVGTMFLG